MSDSTSNVVYQEMTKINLSTTLNINIRDAGTENLISEPVEVSILVPSGTPYLAISGLLKNEKIKSR